MKKTITAILSLFFAMCLMWSGAAITLSDRDYKNLTSFLLVKNEPSVTVDAVAAAAAGEPEVSAKAVCLMEKSTGRVLFAKNENDKLYPASVTKIMTLLLVCESIESGKISLTDSVTASDNASSKGGSQIWLKPGETMTVDELLKAAAVYSANDACTALGEYISGSEAAFVALMNSRAGELGMKNTHFDNCTGLDDTTEEHLTTAYDIALMSAQLLKHDIIKKYSTIWMDSLRDGATQLVNTNKLVRFYQGCTGLKTGTTSKAGCCVSATAQRDGMELIAVVLGSENSNARFSSARNMLDWGFANYEIFCPQINRDEIKSVKVIKGEEESVAPIVPVPDAVLINRGASADIKVVTQLAESVDAPVEDGQIIGSLKVMLGDKTLGEYDIKAEKGVGRLTFFKAALKILRSFADK